MKMLESYHHTIMYPAQQEALDEITQVRKTHVLCDRLPCAVLVPHAALPFVKDALHLSLACSSALNPSLIVFLGPLHHPIMAQDEPAFLVLPQAEGVRIAGNEHRFAGELMNRIHTEHPDAIVREDSYFIEESALELTLPFIDAYHNGVPILPILAGACSGKQLAVYKSILRTIVEKEPNTLFVVSSNANALAGAKEAAHYARTFSEVLATAQSPMQAQTEHRINCCNAAGLEAVCRQKWVSGAWTILGRYLSGKAYDDFTFDPLDSNKYVWHLCAVLGASHGNA